MSRGSTDRSGVLYGAAFLLAAFAAVSAGGQVDEGLYDEGVVEVRHVGESEHVERLLNPGGRPLADGQRLDLHIARELSPRIDGEIESEEWSGALEINTSFAGREMSRHGFPPRAVLCFARCEGPDRFALSVVVDDPVRDVPAPPVEEEPNGGPAPETTPFSGSDHLSLLLWARGGPRPQILELHVSRDGAWMALDSQWAELAIAELDGRGWAVEALVQLPPGTLELPEIGLLAKVDDAARSKATWPRAAAEGAPEAWARLYARPTSPLPPGEG